MKVFNIISEKRILPALYSLAQVFTFTKSRLSLRFYLWSLSEQKASFKRCRRKEYVLAKRLDDSRQRRKKTEETKKENGDSKEGG